MKLSNNLKNTNNILQNFHIDDTKEFSVKEALALKFNELVDHRGLSQMETAVITGMSQPKISQIRHYKLQNISMERLMQALVSLDQSIKIVIQPALHNHSAACITVIT